MTRAPITYRCTHCGSEDVRLDAWAAWDTERQEWTLGSIYQNAFAATAMARLISRRKRSPQPQKEETTC